jgi:hypothetical protein
MGSAFLGAFVDFFLVTFFAMDLFFVMKQI